MTPCTSSLISAFEYDDTAETLTIVFRTNNEVRHYTGFPPELFWEFEESESKGKFFNAKIKAKFEVLKSGKVSDEQLAASLEPAPAVPVEAIALANAVAKEAERVSGADAQFITDEDIQSADPEYVPADENLLPEEEEALAQPAKKQPQVDKLLHEWNALAPATTQPLAIADKNHYVEVADRLRKKVGIRDFVFSILDPTRDMVYKAYKAVQDRQKSILDPMDASITADKRALSAWNTEQERIAREAQQKAQREAEAAAAAEQARRTEDLRLQVAQEQAEAGDTEAAEASLFDQTIQAAPVPVYAPRVYVETPQVEGLSGRKNWKCREVYDLDALILDVAAGIESIKKTGKLMGHAPSTMLLPNMPALNKRAKADENVNLFPGVSAFNDAGLNVKKG